jgi:hypothetical protein
MQALGPLRRQLGQLRRARALTRHGVAVLRLVLCCLATLFVAYVIDRTWQLGLAWRTLLLLASLAGWLLAAWRWWWPALSTRESAEQLALLVEREHGIENDLVAALQFDRQAIAAGESPALAQAVVRYVAEFAPSLDVFRGFRWDPLPRYAVACSACLICAVTWLAIWPQEAGAFWNRFWLGTARYPTKTQLMALNWNGDAIPVFHREQFEVFWPQQVGGLLEVSAEGELPDGGVVAGYVVESGQRVSWPLSRLEQSGAYSVTLPPLSHSVRLYVTLGDASSDEWQLSLLARPLVDLHWTVTPPEYLNRRDPEPAVGARQLSVPAGSRVSLTVVPLNQPLVNGTITIGSQPFELVPANGSVSASGAAASAVSRPPASAADHPSESTQKRVADRAAQQLSSNDERTWAIAWTLPAGSPLDAITAELPFELQVTGESGLPLSEPLRGSIRLAVDRPPRVAAAAISKKVLASAKPQLQVRARDDAGVAKVKLLIELRTSGGESTQIEQSVWTATAPNFPVDWQQSVPLDLSAWPLQPGDQVQVMLQVTDFRGPLPGQSARSEPVVFDVTDRSGVLADLLEADQRTAQQLDAIIERELGLGERAP